jgi:DNA polymerase-3 subunit gamma/tau
MVGQEVLVQTLTNAINLDRLHHAYIFTGIRGVGKTSTARIIAKSLNCTAGTKAQAEPCGTCENCRAIAEDRHIDIIEMDAASNTGVDDVRQIIDGAQYKPVLGRYKIYIIDEVHMLSRSAFNALLKTLEEPPPFVKFIFATTEIRKVPATILSRCQRFDLTRVEPQALFDHFKRICLAEGADIEDEALSIVAKMADGSVRDGLSLLDQIIANHTADGPITSALAAKILGLAGRGAILDLFDAIASANAPGALDMLGAALAGGADAAAVLADLLEATHFITRAKVAPASLALLPMTEAERERIKAFADRLGISALSRMWQMLLKAFDELGKAARADSAIEMAIIRITHAGTLPSPAEIAARIEDSGTDSRAKKKSGLGFDGNGDDRAAALETTEALSALLRSRREVILAKDVENHARFVGFANGVLELNFSDGHPREIVRNLNDFFAREGIAARVEHSSALGAPTIAEAALAAFEEQAAEFAGNPILLEIERLFPGAKIARVE